MNSTITESCRCGAEVTLPSTHTNTLASFREQHRPCIESPPQETINEQVVQVLSAVQLALEHMRLRVDMLAAKVDAHEHAILTLHEDTERDDHGRQADK